MSRYYRILYAVGFTPWEADSENAAPEFRTLIDRVEGGLERPFGAALDLGCGRGRWSLELAERGWDVTGIDVVPKAVLDARRRAEEAGVAARFVEGSVTALGNADLGTGYRLVVDVECFNHLSDEDRAAVGSGVDAVAEPDAEIVLLVWSRARRGPFPPGATREDVAAAFPGWRIVDELAYQARLPLPLRGINPRWYRLARA
ncbi:class I SAM-dependent methyltransferase [Nocardioides limicola]|uniref:class I SAM-dependent methyltransferase n=1 Tax=Nocardioides limicola TaxID=2803368 RepID=UPI00193B2CFB|nr:class I SAM-dependent methyltransferase [Nocardioides sp. DJM-14]